MFLFFLKRKIIFAVDDSFLLIQAHLLLKGRKVPENF